MCGVIQMGWPCQYCPCRFEAASDFKAHMEAFGWNPVAHVQKWREAHRKLEYGQIRSSVCD